MSEIIRHSEAYRRLSHICKTDTGYYFYVDSNETVDCSFETMVFTYDEKNKEVSDWMDLYCRHYDTYNDMKTGHYEICQTLETLLPNEDVELNKIGEI